MQINKIASYIGFAIRSGSAVFGLDRIDTLKNKVFLIISDNSISQNSFNSLVKCKDRLHCPLLVLQIGFLSELVHRDNVKAMAIRDKNLTSAILSAVDGDNSFKLFSGGSN